MFKSWSLKAKTVFAFASVAMFFLVIGGTSIYTLSQVTAKYQTIPEVDVVNMGLVGEMSSAGLHLRAVMNKIATNMSVSPRDMKEVRALIAEGAAAAKDYENLNSKYKAMSFRPIETEEYNKLEAARMNTEAVYQEMIDIASKEKGDQAVFSTLMNSRYLPSSQDQLASLGRLSGLHRAGADQTGKEARKSGDQGNLISLAIIAIGFLAALGVGFIFSSSLARNLSDLSNRLKGEAENVASASRKISDASSELSSSTTEQAAALQETVSSVDEVSAMINKNADNAKQSQDVANQSQQSASKGREAVTSLIHSIDEISRSNNEVMTQIEDSNRQMGEIVKVIADIGNKTKVINDIVFQTKLLSFNASVEAARAGEHGKGFAVVAEEVGNLAQMSGNAAKEISQMLEESSRRVDSIVSQTKSKLERLVVVGKEKVKDGTERARSCSDILEEIVANVAQVSQLMTEIATASSEQSQGVQEITRAMAQLDQVTQQNAASSQDSANSSEGLSAQANELRSIIGQLALMVKGDHGGSGKDVRMATRGQRDHEAVPKTKTAKTLPFKREAAKISPYSSNVSEKKVVGGQALPSEHDPRFEDV